MKQAPETFTCLEKFPRDSLTLAWHNFVGHYPDPKDAILFNELLSERGHYNALRALKVIKETQERERVLDTEALNQGQGQQRARELSSRKRCFFAIKNAIVRIQKRKSRACCRRRWSLGFGVLLQAYHTSATSHTRLRSGVASLLQAYTPEQRFDLPKIFNALQKIPLCSESLELGSSISSSQRLS
ncbi:MAG: hypothetical protein Q9161_003239 [Pseudevernia consocians]